MTKKGLIGTIVAVFLVLILIVVIMKNTVKINKNSVQNKNNVEIEKVDKENINEYVRNGYEEGDNMVFDKSCNYISDKELIKGLNIALKKANNDDFKKIERVYISEIDEKSENYLIAIEFQPGVNPAGIYKYTKKNNRIDFLKLGRFDEESKIEKIKDNLGNEYFVFWNVTRFGEEYYSVVEVLNVNEIEMKTIAETSEDGYITEEEMNGESNENKKIEDQICGIEKKDLNNDEVYEIVVQYKNKDTSEIKEKYISFTNGIELKENIE